MSFIKKIFGKINIHFPFEKEGEHNSHHHFMIACSNRGVLIKFQSVFPSILPRIPALVWTLMISSPLCCSASDFLKVDGTDIRDNYGAGINVHLYGTNLGGWRMHEPWMSPLSGASNEWDARNILTARFGKEAVWDLYNTYWDSWITEVDFKNIAEAGL